MHRDGKVAAAIIGARKWRAPPLPALFQALAALLVPIARQGQREGPGRGLARPDTENSAPAFLCARNMPAKGNSKRENVERRKITKKLRFVPQITAVFRNDSSTRRWSFIGVSATKMALKYKD